MLFEAFALPHQGPLEDHSALLVALAVLGRKLIDPAQLTVAVLAADVSHHVSAGEHHPVLHLAVLEVHHLVEEEGSPCGSSEARGDELRAVGQDGITVGAGEETSAPDVVQEDSAHDCRNQVSHYVGSATVGRVQQARLRGRSESAL